MKKISFKLQIWCIVGWDDNEDTAFLEVDTFEEVLRVGTVLKNVQRVSHNRNEKTQEEYKEIKDTLESNSGEEIMSVGEVVGIRCFYEDDKGMQASMELSDNSGVSGWAKTNSEEHANEYKRLLGEAKKLATQIVRL